MADATIDPGVNQTSADKHQDEKQAPKYYSPNAPDADVDARAGVGAAGRHAAGPGGKIMDLNRGHFSGRPTHGSISPGIGYLYILLGMIMIILVSTLLSGGFVPVDPNGPGGPPTLGPYFNAADYGVQKIIMLPNANRAADNNLQLKTFKVNTCGQKTAIDFLIDTSGSMGQDGKMQKEQVALRSFVSKLTAKSVVGIHTFSRNAREIVPLGYYKDNKKAVEAGINGLRPDRETRTRDGFQLSKRALYEAIDGKKFPADYKYNLILLTDGVPEIPPDQPRSCHFEMYDPSPLYQSNRCFAKEQDPRIPTNLAQDIKAKGITIYTVGIYSQSTTDKQFYPYLSALLKELASSPNHYHESIEGGALDKILQEVLNSICDETGEIGTGSNPKTQPSASPL